MARQFRLATRRGGAIMTGQHNHIARLGLVSIATTLALVAIGSAPTRADQEIAKLTPMDGASGDRFGESVSIDGVWALVGAGAHDERGADSGAAYVFRWNGSSWIQEAKLLADDGAAGDDFAHSVAINGELAIVGAPFNNVSAVDSGAACVFRRNGQTWVQEASLLPTDVNADERFGQAVAIQGNLAVIGAHRNNQLGIRAGAVYVFGYGGSAWAQVAKLLPNTAGHSIGGTNPAGGADDRFIVRDDANLAGPDYRGPSHTTDAAATC